MQGEGGEGREVLAHHTGGPVRVATFLKTPEEGEYIGAVYTAARHACTVCVCRTVHGVYCSSVARLYT